MSEIKFVSTIDTYKSCYATKVTYMKCCLFKNTRRREKALQLLQGIMEWGLIFTCLIIITRKLVSFCKYICNIGWKSYGVLQTLIRMLTTKIFYLQDHEGTRRLFSADISFSLRIYERIKFFFFIFMKSDIKGEDKSTFFNFTGQQKNTYISQSLLM